MEYKLYTGETLKQNEYDVWCIYDGKNPNGLPVDLLDLVLTYDSLVESMVFNKQFEV